MHRRRARSIARTERQLLAVWGDMIRRRAIVLYSGHKCSEPADLAQEAMLSLVMALRHVGVQSKNVIHADIDSNMAQINKRLDRQSVRPNVIVVGDSQLDPEEATFRRELSAIVRAASPNCRHVYELSWRRDLTVGIVARLRGR